MQWTPAALQAFEDYLAIIKHKSAQSGADPQKEAERVRFQVEDAIRLKGLEVVMVDDVRHVMDPWGLLGHEKNNPVGNFWEWVAPVVGFWKSKALLFLGVVFPLMGLMADKVYFNQRAMTLFPSLFHVLLGLMVPLAAGVAWRYKERPAETKPSIPLQILVGAGTAVAVVYVWAIGLLPLSFFSRYRDLSWGNVFYGIPMIALFGLIPAWRFLKSRGGIHQWIGALAVALALFAWETPVLLTRAGMSWAAGENSAQQKRGLSLLRHWDNNDALLAACYGDYGTTHPLQVVTRLLNLPSIPVPMARRLFYQVYGVSFNDRPALKNMAVDPRVEQAGTIVGGRIPGLSLRSSHFDVKPVPDALTAYTEWTLEFENKTGTPQEARGQVALPPGGVVTRLTLWVNGQEREAVFHDKQKVQNAYRQIVNWRRDPVLVTSAGVDRVMVQCFPVPAMGRIKARLGITAPLDSRNPSSARLYGPFFIEKNFDVAPEFRHTLWSAVPFEIKAVGPTLTEDVLSSGVPWTVFSRDPRVETVWTRDPLRADRFIVQKAQWKDGRGKDIVLVLDGSAAMGAAREALRSMLAAFPKDTKVYLAQDGKPAAFTVESLLKKWRGVDFVGGQDNLPALLAAYESATDRVREVLWIHGPQAVELSPADTLRQILERAEGTRVLLSYQWAKGANRLLESLEGVSSVKTLRPAEGPAQDLPPLLTNLAEVHFERFLDDSRPAGVKTSHAIACLWARDSILETLSWNPDRVRSFGNRSLTDAYQKAIAYRLVTPISGAVVLENDFQYVQTGLVGPEIMMKNSGVDPTRMPNPIIGLQSRTPSMEIATGQSAAVVRPRFLAGLPKEKAFRFDGSNRVSNVTQRAQAGARPENVDWEGEILDRRDFVEGYAISPQKGDSRRALGGGWIDDLFTRTILKIGAVVRTRLGRESSAPSWLALFPVFFLAMFHTRQVSRDPAQVRRVAALCLYALSYFVLPSWCVTVAGISLAAYFLRRQVLGPWGSFAMVFFLIMSLPITPMLLEGFTRTFSVPLERSFVTNGAEFRSRAAWIVASLVGLIVSFAPKGWPWILGTAMLMISTLRW